MLFLGFFCMDKWLRSMKRLYFGSICSYQSRGLNYDPICSVWGLCIYLVRGPHTQWMIQVFCPGFKILSVCRAQVLSVGGQVLILGQKCFLVTFMKSVLLLRPSLCLTESKDRIYLLLKYKSIVLQAELVKYLPTKGRKCYSMYRLCNKMKERRRAHAKCSSGKSTLNPSSVH